MPRRGRMADGVATKRSSGKRLPLFARLLEALRSRAASPAPAAATEPGAARESAAASPERRASARAVAPPDPVTVRQWLYGTGFIIPGGPHYVLELVKPFHLGPSMTMLELGSGLGGPARAIAEAFDTYVTGYERDPEFAKRATDETNLRGLSRHVQIQPYDPESIELRAGFFDHVLAREATYNVAQKERLLRVLNQAMKPFGQLILNDFVLDRAAGERAELAAWEETEAATQKPQLWTAAQYSDCFKSLGFDLRIAQDVTPEYRRLILHAWKLFIDEGQLHHLKASQALPVIDEVERTAKAIAALESGALKFFSFVALGGRRRSVVS